MLARLILALLLAAFAFPAVAPAACHDASASRGHGVAMDMAAMSGAQEAMSDHRPDHERDRKATPLHGCIGCVPPSNWNTARVLGVALREPAMVTARVAALDLGAGVAPALRPPREA
jgi:hypothetical protein